jgi:transcriptional coactivator p15 (PC4)
MTSRDLIDCSPPLPNDEVFQSVKIVHYRFKMRLKASPNRQGSAPSNMFELSDSRYLEVETIRGKINVNVRDKREAGPDGVEKPSKKSLSMSSDQWKALTGHVNAVNGKILEKEAEGEGKKKGSRKKKAITSAENPEPEGGPASTTQPDKSGETRQSRKGKGGKSKGETAIPADV